MTSLVVRCAYLTFNLFRLHEIYPRGNLRFAGQFNSSFLHFRFSIGRGCRQAVIPVFLQDDAGDDSTPSVMAALRKLRRTRNMASTMKQVCQTVPTAMLTCRVEILVPLKAWVGGDNFPMDRPPETPRTHPAIEIYQDGFLLRLGQKCPSRDPASEMPRMIGNVLMA